MQDGGSWLASYRMGYGDLTELRPELSIRDLVMQSPTTSKPSDYLGLTKPILHILNILHIL